MCFAEIIRSSSDVRRAYRDLPLHEAWWRIILALHGKPVDHDPYSAASKLCLVRGFRFYGYLYLLLAAGMFAAALFILSVGFADAAFWSVLLVASSVVLSCTCQLAFVGARCYASEPRRATLLLLTFFVSVMTYLSCLCGVCLAIVSFMVPDYKILASITLAGLMMFGIGSYFVEILFLASVHWNPRLSP